MECHSEESSDEESEVGRKQTLRFLPAAGMTFYSLDLLPRISRIAAREVGHRRTKGWSAGWGREVRTSKVAGGLPS
jgi:hypothetical protein